MLNTNSDTMKTQKIRLLDIVVIGPLMIVMGIDSMKKGQGILKALGLSLTAFGATTIAYNASNYLRVASGNVLSGGLGDKLKLSDVDQDELTKGISVEKEHTNDPLIAREIALDHLAEHPHYYTHLEKMESEMPKPG